MWLGKNCVVHSSAIGSTVTISANQHGKHEEVRILIIGRVTVAERGMELFDLQVFVRVADTKSISASARSLQIPKSSVSRALSRLESDVGKILIDRSTNPLRLSDAGTFLHPYAINLLRDADAAKVALDEFSEIPKGTLKISATHTFASKIIAPMLPSFVELYPEVRVVIDTDNHPVDLRSEDVSLAIRLGALPDSELIAQKIGSMELWICAGETYLSRRGRPKTIQDLAGHDLISRVNRTHQWRFFSSSGGVQEIQVIPGTVVPEPAVMLSVLIGGMGIGRLPDYMARFGMECGEVERVLPEFNSGVVDVFAVYTNRKALPHRARAFINSLSEYMTALQAGQIPPRKSRV